MDRSRPSLRSPRPRRSWRWAAVALVAAVVLTGCGADAAARVAEPDPAADLGFDRGFDREASQVACVYDDRTEACHLLELFFDTAETNYGIDDTIVGAEVADLARDCARGGHGSRLACAELEHRNTMVRARR